MEYIYILRSFTRENTLLKFGFTADIWARLGQYKTSKPGIEIVYIAQLEDAFALEQAFHRENSSFCGNEWYTEDILPIMMSYLSTLSHIDYTCETKPVNKITFQEVVEKCQEGDEDYIAWAYNKYDFLQDALQHIGYEKIKALEYHVGNVKKLTSKYNHKPYNEEIKSCVDTYKDIAIGLFISSKRLKNIFNEIYSNLGIDKTPKATDLQEYYNIKDTVKSIKGSLERGYIIIDEKH